MPQTREADALKAARQRRETRYLTPDRLGRKCPECKTPMAAVLVDAGETTHPSCGPEARWLLTRDAARRAAEAGVE